MESIPIQNETDYPLTDAMTQYIIRDAQEHFGEEVRAIRVQAGIERHAFNARTHEAVRVFSPRLWLWAYDAHRPRATNLRAASRTAALFAQRCGARGSDHPRTIRGP